MKEKNTFEVFASKKYPTIEKFLRRSKRDLKGLFGVDIPLPAVFLLKSRKEIDAIFGKKTESWMVGWAKDNVIFILHPDFFAKESDHKNPEHFWKVLKHEYCHLYFQKATDAHHPQWLNEGLACHLAGQIKKAPSKKEALKVFSYFQNSDKNIYSIGYFWVALLMKKFGKKKMQTLLKNLQPSMTQSQFKKAFYGAFKVRYSKSDFIKMLK